MINVNEFTSNNNSSVMYLKKKESLLSLNKINEKKDGKFSSILQVS